MSDNYKQTDSSIAPADQQSDPEQFQFDHSGEPDPDEDEVEDDSEDVKLADVRERVTEEFDEDMWHVTEALLSAHATLLIDSVRTCTGLIIVGESGAGKTTAIRFLDGIDEQVYRSDEATPASFVSHDASMTEEQLQEVDLLPRIKHKTLVCRDMATWFSGQLATIEDRMSLMANLMDGEGLIRDTGAQGERGYEGEDYRFTVIGASTPLQPRAWNALGHTGRRFVFHEKCSTNPDSETLKTDLFGDRRYHERVQACREVTHEFLDSLWSQQGGYKNVDNVEISAEAQDALLYLGQVVKYSRATLEKNQHESYEVGQEGIYRIVSILRDIAEGRAILEQRETVTIEDVQVSARIALSTMPRKRRPLVRALLDPATVTLQATDVEDILGCSRPTATDRMRILIGLGIAEWVENDDGRDTLEIEVSSGFEWPDTLDFPRFGGADD